MRQWLYALLLCTLSAAAWSAPADEEAVRAAFQAYKTAVLDRQGVNAADRVTSGTLDAYQRYRELALNGDRATLQALPITDRLQVLIIRHRVPTGQLHAMNGRAVFIYAVDRGWIGRESVVRTSIGEVSVDGDTATAGMRMGQAETPMNFEFQRQQGQWRFDLMPVIRMSESVFAQMAEQHRISENQLVMNLVGAVSGQPVDDSIWDAPAK
ncbi:hypothetical protein [Pseudoxanthomonas wuyuanensis]|uniref:Uncharacterized protein n=1 Tax=Pseudoxanthomonas wuyuanensis TaxID=1073196 RepID=A0A286CVG1_9GAMM|nr:hypothetical protein [Pseudoxanthomonas wuyuanensis]SOD50386.1 hypothetical protein SAMN06296416_10196 [Pseudoxanthomonas wuyuanensis]